MSWYATARIPAVDLGSIYLDGIIGALQVLLGPLVRFLCHSSPALGAFLRGVAIPSVMPSQATARLRGSDNHRSAPTRCGQLIIQ